MAQGSTAGIKQVRWRSGSTNRASSASAGSAANHPAVGGLAPSIAHHLHQLGQLCVGDLEQASSASPGSSAGALIPSTQRIIRITWLNCGRSGRQHATHISITWLNCGQSDASHGSTAGDVIPSTPRIINITWLTCGAILSQARRASSASHGSTAGDLIPNTAHHQHHLAQLRAI